MTGCYTLPMLVAFDIGGTRIRAARSPTPGLVEPFAEWPTPIRDFDALSDCLKQALSQAGGTAAALSLAGVFDPVTGRARVANIPCIDGRNLSADLQARLNLPVRIANDADCFALAEALSGVGRGHHTVFGIILGTGTGGGLVIDGRLHPGFGGAAGEWGHGPVLRTRADNEPTDIPHWPCGCGLSGCLDTLAGARGLERLDRHLNATARDSRAILVALAAGEPHAARTLNAWLDLVSAPLAMILNVIGASIVPVGGGLSNDKALIAALDRVTRTRLLAARAVPLLVPAHHRVEPGLIGASHLFAEGQVHGVA